MIADADNGEADDNGVGDAVTGELQDPHRARGTLKMIEQAIKHRWKIPASVFEALPAHIGRIALNMAEGSSTVNSGEVDIRHQVPAARVLVLMQGQNQADDKQPEPARPSQHVHFHGAPQENVLEAISVLDKLEASPNGNGHSGAG